MGNKIFTSIKNIFSKTPEARVHLVGLDAAGKTTILYKLILKNENFNTCPTIGFNVETYKINKVKLNLWDVGGGDKIRELVIKNFLKEMDVLIFIVDSNDRERVLVAKEYFWKIFKEYDNKNFFTLVFANKQDLKGSMSENEVIENFELFKLHEGSWACIGCSAMKGDGIFEGFELVAEKILEKEKLKKKKSFFSFGKKSE